MVKFNKIYKLLAGSLALVLYTISIIVVTVLYTYTSNVDPYKESIEIDGELLNDYYFQNYDNTPNWKLLTYYFTDQNNDTLVFCYSYMKADIINMKGIIEYYTDGKYTMKKLLKLDVKYTDSSSDCNPDYLNSKIKDFK